MKLIELSLEIIQKCPNNCIYCSSNSSIEAKNIISFSVFKHVIDDAVKLGLKKLCISGGEPFLHPNLIEMVEYAKKYGLEVYIYTSGIVIDECKNYSSISTNALLQLHSIGLNKLIFNMQASEEELYDSIMGTTGLLPVLKKSIIGANDCGLFTEIHFVPMKINYEQINKVLQLASELNVKKVSFLRFVLQGRAHNHTDVLEMKESDLEKLHELLSQIKQNRSIDIRVGTPLHEKSDHIKCSAGWGKLIIRYDGAVFPCEAFKYIEKISNGKLVYPDNVNTKRFYDIWESSQFLKCLRNEIAVFHENSFDCETCPAQWRIHHI